MSDFSNATETNGLSVKLWRGERMALIGMDMADPEPDFVGFAIEVKNPDADQYQPLRNRLNFAYDRPEADAVNGYRNFPSTEAPFQKFRWVHFPYVPKAGAYSYRVTKMHMPTDMKLVKGTSMTLDIPLDPVIYDGFLDVGFTRNFASSQAYLDRYDGNKDVIPDESANGLAFKKVEGDVYEWLGFEAYQLIFNTLHEVVEDESLELDLFAFDLNEPDMVSLLVRMGKRLRAIIDDSRDHSDAETAESIAAKRFSRSARAKRLKRMHFGKLQHHKVLIVKKDGKPIKVLFGSTNFSFRGIYIQANNAVLCYSPDVAQLFEEVFETSFENDGQGFAKEALATKWHLVHIEGKPTLHFCFSPHSDTDLSLNPVAAAIDQASSSVFFAIAFLGQSGVAVREATDRLTNKDVFSYGVVDALRSLEVHKPDGSIGIVDFQYLKGHTPEPFKAEWSGNKGRHEHHKFVVTDFNLPTAKVFAGSSNLSPNGEKGNGDNLVMIEDSKVATSYAIEAIRVFDHLHFRTKMEKAGARPRALSLRKPKAITGKPNWFEEYYSADTQKERDRLLFSH